MKIRELLDAVKNAKGISTDYALAKTLGLPRARICDYYKGTRTPDEFACLKIAEALGKPLDQIIATVKATSEKDEKRREAWENYMKRLGGVAASFTAMMLVYVTLIVTPHPAEAAVTPFDYANSHGIQIMRLLARVVEAARNVLKMLFPRVGWLDSPNSGITA